MVAIPENVMAAIKDQASVKSLTTICAGNRPHSIVAGTIMALGPETMVIGEVLMKRTSNNLKQNPKAAFLITKGMESYEIQVTAKDRLTSGAIVDQMNAILEPMHMHAGAVWTFDVVSVYDESAGPNAGKKLA
ncbi:MAG: hypothetical protein MJZ38_01570 [archaeon]|nr:hypothetical protein [archaeon]